MQAQIAIIGLAVMGQNLALNMVDKGFRVAVYNRSREKTDTLMLNFRGDPDALQPYYSLHDLVTSLDSPRKILIMVKAGDAVDQFIQQLLPLLEPGDLIMDGGNSYWPDTERRIHALRPLKIGYLGVGISGGEEGARLGPSMMVGGDFEEWEKVRDIFEKISAQVKTSPCAGYVGRGGAGHFVKMVHNGIEYGDMQLIAEAVDLLSHAGYKYDTLGHHFTEWNFGRLNSYLIEITAQILQKREGSGFLLDAVLDCAEQKGTGRWTVTTALDIGVTLSLVAEAVFARMLSSMKSVRVHLAQRFPKTLPLLKDEERTLMLRDAEEALYASKILSYTQGFTLMQQASTEHDWQINLGNVALLWRGGCIIRSVFLNDIYDAFYHEPSLSSLLEASFFGHALKNTEAALRRTIIAGVRLSIPMPAHSAGLSLFDGLTQARSSAALIQAQRDLFGAHQFERVDQPRGKYFHAEWTL